MDPFGDNSTYTSTPAVYGHLGGPFFAKVKLVDAELLLDHQFQFLDGGRLGGHLQPVLEEVRFRWTDWLYTGAPRMDIFAGHRIFVGWDPVAFQAWERGVAMEGAQLWGFRVNALAGIIDTNINEYMGGIQIQRLVDNWDLSFVMSGNARYSIVEDPADLHKYLVTPAQRYNRVSLFRWNGTLAQTKGTLSGFAASQEERLAQDAEKKTSSAIQVDLTHSLQNGARVDVGWRDYNPEFNPPYKKFEWWEFGWGNIDDPMEKYAGEKGAYAQVNWSTSWPQKLSSDLNLRYERFLARPVPWWDPNWKGPGGEWIRPLEDTTASIGRLEWKVEGYRVTLDYRHDSAEAVNKTRDRYDLGLYKEWTLDSGKLDFGYQGGLDVRAEDNRTIRHRIRLDAAPSSTKWSKLRPYLEYSSTQGKDNTTSSTRVGAVYTTIGGIRAEGVKVFSDVPGLRNQSFVKISYSVGF